VALVVHTTPMTRLLADWCRLSINLGKGSNALIAALVGIGDDTLKSSKAFKKLNLV
jgi:hypothetical protein